MYPDYLSLSGRPEVNKVAQEFRDYGTIISPMGCRAYLSHFDDENGARTIGRCNIGAVSLNVPVIIAVAKHILETNISFNLSIAPRRSQNGNVQITTGNITALSCFVGNQSVFRRSDILKI